MIYIFTGNDSEYVFDTGVLPNGYGMKCRYDSSEESFNTTNIQDSINNVQTLGLPLLEERIKTIPN